jgi:acetyl/propionyl-CoA carboxylase alpha subunit
VVHPSFSGHAIQARLYAEDVGAGFLPTSGPVHRLRIDAAPDVRVDAGYADGSIVSTHYDGLLAKVIVWAPTRTQAARRLAEVLQRSEIHGVTTNRDLLVRTLRHPEFLAGQIDTGFFERNDPVVLGRPDDAPELMRLHAVAVAVAGQRAAAAGAPVPDGIPPAWRNVGQAAQPLSFRCGDREVKVVCALTRRGIQATVDGSLVEELLVNRVTPEVVELEIARVRHHVTVHRVGAMAFVDSALGSSTMRQLERFPTRAHQGAAGSLHAPLPGTVTRVLVREGDRVRFGQPLLALEAMKMEHTINAANDGIVSHLYVELGTQVEPTTVLLVITDPDAAP